MGNKIHPSLSSNKNKQSKNSSDKKFITPKKIKSNSQNQKIFNSSEKLYSEEKLCKNIESKKFYINFFFLNILLLKYYIFNL